MLDDLFHKCVEIKAMKDGRFEIHCKRGLWCVSGTDMKRLEFEAKHYWRQYMDDGEYELCKKQLMPKSANMLENKETP